MASVLKQAWWMLLLRGAAAIVFGMLLLTLPGLALTTGAISIVLLFSIYMLVDGIGTIIGAVSKREGQWFLLLLLGAVSVIAGIVALANPLLFATFTLAILVVIIAVRALFGGVIEIITAVQLRKEIDNEWLLLLSGLLSVIFGLILIVRPLAAVEALIVVVGFYAVIFGVMQLLLAFRVRGWVKQIGATT